MATYSTNEFKSGLKIIIDKQPFVILSHEFVKPGKGQAFTRIKIRNLQNNRVIEKTYKSGDSVEAADIEEYDLQYLYNDGELWYFMDPNNFDQFEVPKAIVGDTAKWIVEQDMCQTTFWNGTPLIVSAPIFVVQEIVETDPGLRGDTSGGGSKPAVLSGGAVVKVPLFVQMGEKIKVNTSTGEYESRVK